MMRKPTTGEVAVAFTVWFEGSGSSPNKPFTTSRWWERRYVKVPGHLVNDRDEPMSISTEEGETKDI